MHRTDVVLRAALPMAVLNVLLWLMTSHESRGAFLLFIFGMPLVAYFGGGEAARKLGATWREIVLGFVAALAPLALLEPMLIFTSIFLGGAGLLLLPLFSKSLRLTDESVALPARDVLTFAGAVIGVLVFIGSRYAPLPGAVIWSFLACYEFFLPIAVVSGALSIAGQTRIGAWVGAVGASALWMSFGLLLLVLPLLK